MLVLLVIMFSLAVECKGNQCFRMDTLPDMYRGMKVNDTVQPFLFSTAAGPIDCARRCKLYSLCSCVNFHIPTSGCELLAWNFDAGAFVSNTQYLTIDVRTWTDRISGVCEHHKCPNDTVCKPDNANYYCEPVGCIGLPPVADINMTSFTVKALWAFGDIVEYACLRGFFPKSNATCLASGKWSNFTCYYLKLCGETGNCEPRKTTDYWLYSTLLHDYYKIFCRATPAKGPFLSLNETNMASFPAFTRYQNSCEPIEATIQDPDMGIAEFSKIRLVPNKPIIDKEKIFDHYVNYTQKIQKFGLAGDCYAGNDSSECGVIGRFLINTRGTGLRVKPSVQWKTWGVNGVIMNITRSDDGHMIEGFCGGNCGGCEPDGDILLEIDLLDTPLFESAEFLICKFPL
ncbi:hypothetical protein LOTGIDRAFT_157913 [Lottia gigantea]|uniref:GON domain-containing protein n=1 Tax=Lottia gigantea TaxID=225164 RepID=V4AZQ1_LOTGI|nr:hypothetical protein LOTGIDRAFT_157913 [Lottia gigantea]ESP00631.1 hypothetical protein LOTGIDRAFT_157913 [Lottia gigantea]